MVSSVSLSSALSISNTNNKASSSSSSLHTERKHIIHPHHQHHHRHHNQLCNQRRQIRRRNQGVCSAALTNGQKVALHYKLTNGETDELIDDTSTRGQAVEITLGSGELFPKLEAQLLTSEVGSKVKLTLEPEDTYGNFDENKIQKQPILPEEMVQVKDQVQPGQVVQLAPNVIAKVVEIGEDSLTLDFNHPLAGLKLTFEVDVIAVKDAPTLFGTPMVKFTPPGQPR
ncbi:unnamed protein product [Bathycoccus prasinos]